MRKSVSLFCFWSIYCCFAAGSHTPMGPEGQLEGNVQRAYYYCPPHLLSVLGPLCPPNSSSVPSFACYTLPPSPLRCSFSFPSSALDGGHLFLALHPRGNRWAGCTLLRPLSSPSLFPCTVPLIGAVQPAELPVARTYTFCVKLCLVFGNWKDQRLLERALCSSTSPFILAQVF
jgi:hypothetical protein